MGAASVVLTGRPGGTTALAVEVLRDLPEEFRLIGGLAVLCRVGVPHRATVDLDALARNLAGFEPELRRLAVSAAGGGQYRMAGDLDLDVIDVSPDDADALVAELVGRAGGEPLTDLEVNVVAHTWAHDTAAPVDLAVVSEVDGALLASAPARLVASPGGLVAMKAASAPLRASSRPEKRASDLYDLTRLVAETAGVAELSAAPPVLRVAVGERLREWFVDPRGRDRTFREVRRFDLTDADLEDAADAVAAIP